QNGLELFLTVRHSVPPAIAGAGRVHVLPAAPPQQTARKHSRFSGRGSLVRLQENLVETKSEDAVIVHEILGGIDPDRFDIVIHAVKTRRFVEVHDHGALFFPDNRISRKPNGETTERRLGFRSIQPQETLLTNTNTVFYENPTPRGAEPQRVPA